MTQKFSYAGPVTISHINARKEGPDGEKALAVDLKLSLVTDADYLTVRQLLAIHGQTAPVTEPHIGAGRVHRIARPADSAPKLVSQAEYIAALSKTEWCSTAAISVSLDVATHVVKQRLMGVNMRPLVEVRTAGRGGRYEWRLK